MPRFQQRSFRFAATCAMLISIVAISVVALATDVSVEHEHGPTDEHFVQHEEHFVRSVTCLDGPSNVYQGDNLYVHGHDHYYHYFRDGTNIYDERFSHHDDSGVHPNEGIHHHGGYVDIHGECPENYQSEPLPFEG